MIDDPVIHRSQRLPLRLNKEQRRYMAMAAGTARVAYNWALAEWKRQATEWWESGMETPYPGAFALQKQFNAIKREQFPWITEVAAEIAEKAIFSVGLAFEAFKAGKSRYPRFKSRKSRRSFVGASGAKDIRMDTKGIRLPRIGRVRMVSRLRWPEARVISAVVSETAGKWYVALTCELPPKSDVERAHLAAGVDLGIKTPLVVTAGATVAEFGASLSERLNVERRKLKRASQRVSRRVAGSGRRKRAKLTVARIHARMASIRSDIQHKATCRIAAMASRIGVETLAVRNMMANGRLARSIADVGFFEVKRQLKYKAEQVVEADRFYPSSKTCSACGSIKSELKLSDRTYRCQCGFECDRDENAARNLEKMAANWVVSARGDGSSAPKRKLRLSSLSAKREAKKFAQLGEGE